jgi:hypothetical protein
MARCTAAKCTVKAKCWVSSSGMGSSLLMLLQWRTGANAFSIIVVPRPDCIVPNLARHAPMQRKTTGVGVGDVLDNGEHLVLEHLTNVLSHFPD